MSGETSQMRGRLGRLLSLVSSSVLIAVLHRSAHAQGLPALRVEREPGAEGCPDAASLGERIVAIRGRADTPNHHRYELSFTHSADSYSATIRSEPKGESQRVLTDQGHTCTAVAQAAAVTLALLFDSDAERAPPAKPAPAPPPTPAPAKLESIAAKPTRAHSHLQGTLSLGVGALSFVIRPLSPVFGAEIGVRAARFRGGLGVLWVPPQVLTLDPGHVKEWLLSGVARACVPLIAAPRIALDVCSGLLVGALDARADGFTNNEHRRRVWLAVPLGLSLSHLSGSLGWELSASALGALVHHDFEVEGLGVAYGAPRVGGLLTLRAVGLFPAK